jgi:hypothetical protein
MNELVLPGRERIRQVASRGIIELLTKEGYVLAYHFVLFKAGVRLEISKGGKSFSTEGPDLVQLILDLPNKHPVPIPPAMVGVIERENPYLCSP